MLASDENTSDKYIQDFIECLEGGDPRTAVKFMESDVSQALVKNAWQIIPVVSSHLTTLNTIHSRQMFDACEEVLNIIAAKCDPSETVLELLEQIEYSKDDTKFCTILKPLSKSLEKSSDKARAIEWCIGTIKSYIEELPVLVPECKTATTIGKDVPDELDNNARRLVQIYNSVLTFVEPFVKEASLPSVSFGKQKVLKDNLTNFLIYLLGKPLCYVCENTNGKISSLPEAIIALLSPLMGDFLCFINVLDDRVNRQKTNMGSGNTDQVPAAGSLEKEDEVPNVAYSNFYFYIITKKSLWLKSPQVYDPRFLLQSSLYLIKCLLEEDYSALIRKGLRFMDNILLRLDKRSVHANALQINIYAELFDSLVKVMVFCDSDVERKTALGVFHKYMEIFDMEARHLILMHLYDTGEHSGLLSLITGIVKSCVIESIELDPPSPHFLGNAMRALLKRACRLPHGAATDLVEISEEVVATLNLLRFLIIRDRDNATGIWTVMCDLQNDYLTPLRKGLDLCRGHWLAKLTDFEKVEKSERARVQARALLENDVTITVGRARLPPMPIADKIHFSHQALTSIDMMESILVRVNECIADRSLR